MVRLRALDAAIEGSTPSSPAIIFLLRTCVFCKVPKPLSDFYVNQYKCKDCHREYMKTYYRENPDKRDEHVSRRKARIKEQVNEYKVSRGCMDCGQSYPYYVLQFDHRGDKKFTISKYMTSISIKSLWDEIAKCDVVCANCHAERTHGNK